MSEYVPEDLIAAPATPFGRGALAVIRASGKGCIDSFAPLFDKPGRIRDAAGYTMHHGRIVTDGGEPVDEVMVAVFRAPASYTGQDSVEISCHGSPAGVERVLALLYRAGFRAAGPGEFTMRAFLNGKMDLTRAEAVDEVVSSRTQEAHAMALHRLSGSVERRVNEVKQQLVELLARVEIQLDYPEEDTGEVAIPAAKIEDAGGSLRELLATYRTGRVYQEGARVAIAGKTNAGKSSLFNLFLREDRSIVSEIHGTTRDYIESEVSVDGIPVRLFDTAGMRASDETIESEGIRRSGMVIDHAEMVLYVVDATRGFDDEDRREVERAGDKTVVVWNKVDLPGAEASPADTRPARSYSVSAVTGEGFGDLQEEMIRRLVPEPTAAGAEPVIDSLRQKQLLERSLSSLDEVKRGLAEGVPVDAVSLDLQDAVNALGEITGEVTTADILDTMFSGFCVGK